MSPHLEKPGPLQQGEPPWETGTHPVVRPPPGAPRLGFAGAGWFGRRQMEELREGGIAEVTAVAEPVGGVRARAAGLAPDAILVPRFRDLLDLDLDGVVIATPSPLHVEHAIAALESGLAVFCDRPLASTARDTRLVLDAARAADRLLAVDLPYRATTAVRAIYQIIRSGQLGRLYAGHFVLHTSGAEDAWRRERHRGRGCLVDLGGELIDLALWLFGQSVVTGGHGRRFEGGRRLDSESEGIEDVALIELDLEGGAALDLACSRNLHTGRDAVFELSVYGERGGVAVKNEGGSPSDLVAEISHGPTRRIVRPAPVPLTGPALREWCEQLAEGRGYDPAIERLAGVADVVDALYRGAEPGRGALGRA